jgi:hypothetical protein
MRVSVAMLALSLVDGCSRSAPPPTPPPTGSALFCAYGGVGLVPIPAPPEFETELAVVVVDVQNQGPAPRNVVVTDVVLVNAEGTTTALRRVQAVEVLSTAEPAPSPRAPGSWAYYLNPGGQPFNGTLRVGRTRLRIRVSLKASPVGPVRFQLTFGLEAPLVVEGGVNGTWPT